MGGAEAPPAIISIFLGSDLEDIFKSIAYKEHEVRNINNKIKVESLGEIDKDSSDRNRTSSVAFTGNKFEFRMLGSSKMAADINIVINAGLAYVLKKFADRLEGLDESELKEEVYKIVEETIKNYGGVLYDGDNYSDYWIEEAKRRGLKNHKTLMDALTAIRDEDSSQIFYKSNIFSKKEVQAMYEVYLQDIIKYHSLELRIAKDMIIKDIIPAAIKEINQISSLLNFTKNIGLENIVKKLNKCIEKLLADRDKLVEIYDKSLEITDSYESAKFLQENTVSLLEDIRKYADELEKLVSRENYTLPTYEDIFSSLN